MDHLQELNGDMVDEFLNDDDLEMDENGGVTSKHVKFLENLFGKFESYCKELAVFEFYGNYWHCHPDQLLYENVVHPTVKDKDNNPMTVKDIDVRDQQRVRDLQDKGYTREIIWEKDWQTLASQYQKLKPISLNIVPACTHFKHY